MWTKAWQAGITAAEQAAGHKASTTLTSELTSLLAQLASAWVAQIAQTTLKLLAKALAAGAALTALQAILDDLQRARDIALTEITRVMAIAAQKVYTDHGDLRWRWVIEDDNACAACKGNADAGPWPIGVPFPSGAPYPPDHYRCRCGTIPA